MRNSLLATALIIGCITVIGTQAHAQSAPVIQLQSGGTTLSTQTGANPLTVSEPIGNFTTTANTGIVTSTPSLDLGSLDISSTGPGTLVVTLSANDFTTPLGATNWWSQFSGNFLTGTATVTLQTFLDNTNTLLGTGTLLSTLTDTAAGFAVSDIVGATTDDPFALTEVLTIVTTGPAALSLDAGLTNVPEPVSISLLATGLLGLGLIRRRKA